MCSVLQARRAVLGPQAPPLPVIGPYYLHQVLKGWQAVQPLAFHFIDTRQTIDPDRGTGLYTRQVSTLAIASSSSCLLIHPV